MTLFRVTCIVCGVVFAISAFFIAMPYINEQIWYHNSQSVKKGMSVEEVEKLLGVGQKSPTSHFQTDGSNEGVNEYHNWNKGNIHFEIGIKDGKVRVLHTWYCPLF